LALLSQAQKNPLKLSTEHNRKVERMTTLSLSQQSHIFILRLY